MLFLYIFRQIKLYLLKGTFIQMIIVFHSIVERTQATSCLKKTINTIYMAS